MDEPENQSPHAARKPVKVGVSYEKPEAKPVVHPDGGGECSCDCGSKAGGGHGGANRD